ncbi:hypothetical protein B7463_g8733, partial [Scytalidium lignicola]
MANTEPSKPFGPFTEGLEIASAYKDFIKGKTIFITGVAANSLGGEAALAIATSLPALLILSARNSSRAELIASKIRALHPFVSTPKISINVVINSAAIMAAPYSKTADGFESQFEICHLAHFLATNLILAKGLLGDGGRVVNVTSTGHRFSDVRREDPGFSNGESYNQWRAYGQAKTANMLFSIALADSKMLQKRRITSFSIHPGMTRETLQQGVSTYLVWAFDPDIINYNGAYLEDCQIRKPRLAYAGSLERAHCL